ncbi:ABC transporter permease [Amycolatopsis magusensis]|uniref:ABC-2 type transport system permease protein n=1 Tax=Amycolatopsis magusensis TaxID=882444 RepID=A0ABS4PKI4_9PSEU|nr:ABC transporter permease [Amycolatopsis magusensis]MBP2179405.1 ABC-2 type transport system permease protein [Amycolatopsis magusensis]
MTTNPLLGTRHLVRLALRRDRIVLPVWILLLGAIPAAVAGSYAELYKTEAERQSLTTGMAANPSLNLIYGPPFDLSDAGGFTVWRYGTLVPFFLAMACIFTVTRHTRQEEDTGRQELLSSGVLGRFAALTAGVVTGALTAAGTGLLTVVALAGAGVPVSGAVAFGAAIALVGLVFTAVGAITAQLAEYARTANGLAMAVLGIAFLLRAVGDAAKDVGWLSWLSPIGWSTQVRPFAGERWWVLGLLLGTAIALGAVAYALSTRRDVGLGLLPARPGPATAAPGLRSPLALAWRLHRGSFLGWTLAFAVMGALFGSLAAGIGDVMGESQATREMLARMGGADQIVDAFLGTLGQIFAIIASMYGVQAALRMRAEEVAVRVEPLLATRVGRLRWTAGHLLFALLGSAVMMAVAAVLAGLLHGLRVSDVANQVPSVLGATMAQLPAVWVVLGATVLLFGFLPKYATVAWAVAGVCVMLSLFGPVLQLSQVVQNISPFTHVPKLPGAEFTATPLLWLAGISVVALGVGLAGFRRRDIG